jgi:translation initiation factor 2B subunit (eIF-2B alpha/beta/delta family)
MDILKKRRQKKLDKIVKDIKNIKIQGATNIAKAALSSYSLLKTESTYKKLVSARPTEPLLVNSLNYFKQGRLSYKEVLNHFSQAQKSINNNTLKLINKNNVIMTHCHSTNVVNALINAKKQGKKFQVYNTETRPLHQGRKTAKSLAKAGIKITNFVDSAIATIIEKQQNTEKVDKVFLGCDAILSNGIINKVGSSAISKIAYMNKVPVYIIADSWKFSKLKIKIEQRNINEIWNKAPKNIKIRNPAFEFVEKKYIKAIVSELGVLSFNEFLKKVKKNGKNKHKKTKKY